MVVNPLALADLSAFRCAEQYVLTPLIQPLPSIAQFQTRLSRAPLNSEVHRRPLLLISPSGGHFSRRMFGACVDLVRPSKSYSQSPVDREPLSTLAVAQGGRLDSQGV